MSPNHGTMQEIEYLDYEAVVDRDWTVDDEDLFEKAAAADLEPPEYGSFEANEAEYILEAAEARGHEWPFSCRAGACANCAGIVHDGAVEMDMQQILSDEEVADQGIRLTCVSRPASDEVKLVYNVKHLDSLQDRVIG